MKSINQYINESSSLFDSGGYEDMATNYLDYYDGDKKFGELKKNDIIYLYSYSNDKIIEVTINGSVKTINNKICIKTKSFKIRPNSKYCKPQTTLIFGPANGSRSGRIEDDTKVVDYSPWKVEESSICISFGGGYAFGTNKDNVLKYAKSDITSSINKIQNDIEKLQNQIEILNKKLENIK